MMNLNSSYNKPLRSKVLLKVIAAAALIGVADTIYLTANHYWGSGVECFLLKGCDIVLASKYSIVLGVPLSLLGLLFYSAIFGLVNIVDIYGSWLYVKFLAGAGILGFIASLCLVYIQIFILGSFCIYCLLSAISSTTIFASVVLLLRSKINSNPTIMTHY